MLFMCVGPVDPWATPLFILKGIALIAIIYVLYRVLGPRYPKYRSDMKAIVIVLSVLIAIGIIIITFFTGTLC